MKNTQIVKQLLEGNYIENISQFIKYPHKYDLTEAEETHLKKLERCRELLIFYNHSATDAVKMLIDEFQIDYRRAYKILNDCKEIYGILERFDYMYEMLIVKERIDKTMKKAESDKDWNAYSKLIAQHQEWAEKMKAFQEAEKIYKLPTINITFSMDPELLGISREVLAEWGNRVDYIKNQARKKFKSFEIEEADVE